MKAQFVGGPRNGTYLEIRSQLTGQIHYVDQAPGSAQVAIWKVDGPGDTKTYRFIRHEYQHLGLGIMLYIGRY